MIDQIITNRNYVEIFKIFNLIYPSSLYKYNLCNPINSILKPKLGKKK
jgi:hypothetical protein